jgi:hypothetical protein
MKPYITVIILEQKENPTKKRKNPTKTNKQKQKTKNKPNSLFFHSRG